MHPIGRAKRYYMVFIYCAVASLLSADQNLMAPNLTCAISVPTLKVESSPQNNNALVLSLYAEFTQCAEGLPYLCQLRGTPPEQARR